MIQKTSLYSIAVILLLSLSAAFAPIFAEAADPKVSDWVEDDQPAGESDTEETVASDGPEEKSFVVIIGQLILYTLLIVFLIYGLIKFLAMRQKNMQPNQAVKLMGGTPLGNNKSLQLVKVGNQMLLVGVGDQVTLIKEFSAEDEINGIEKDLDNQPAALLPKSIASFIKEKFSSRAQSAAKTNAGFENLFKQSLDKQKAKQDKLKLDLNKQDDDKEGRPL